MMLIPQWAMDNPIMHSKNMGWYGSTESSREEHVRLFDQPRRYWSAAGTRHGRKTPFSCCAHYRGLGSWQVVPDPDIAVFNAQGTT